MCLVQTGTILVYMHMVNALPRHGESTVYQNYHGLADNKEFKIISTEIR